MSALDSPLLAGFDFAAYSEAAIRVAIEDDPNALWNQSTLQIERELSRVAVRDPHFLKSWNRQTKEAIFDAAKLRLYEELAAWVSGRERCNCGGRSFVYWVERALTAARKTYVNRAKRRVYTDVASLGERTSYCSMRIEARSSSDHDASGLSRFDTKTAEYFRGNLGLKEEPADWRDNWFLGWKPKAYRPPKLVDEETRAAVATTEAEKIRIAVDDDRTGQIAHGITVRSHAAT